jgi:hypothetical protein
MTRIIEWFVRQFDPSAEPVRLAVFFGLVVAAVAHNYFPGLAVELDVLTAIVAGAWARAKVSPTG